jgi:hypothetical protein
MATRSRLEPEKNGVDDACALAAENVLIAEWPGIFG